MNGLFRTGAVAALALLCALQLLALALAPPAWVAREIEVRLLPGESILLGRRELAAPQADTAHLLLRRDAAGRWSAQNASMDRQLLLERAARTQPAGSVLLTDGQRIRLGATDFNVRRSPEGLELHSGADSWGYDGATVTRNGQPQPACPGASIGNRLGAAWNRWSPTPLRLARPLAFGGNLHCGNRIGASGVDTGSARAALTPDGYVLSAPPSLMVGAGSGRQVHALQDVGALIVGHTRLALRIDGERLLLQPSGHVTLLASPRTQLPPQVAWSLQPRSLWTLPAAPATPLFAAAAVLLASAAGWLASRRAGSGSGRQAFLSTGGGTLLSLAGGALLVLQQSGDPPGAGIAMLAGAGALWYLMLGWGRLRLVPCAAALLLGLGLLAQLELGLGSDDAAALRHATRSATLAAIGLGALPLLRHLAPRAPLRQAAVEWLLLGAAGIALAALLLQAALGDETGVFGVQPVEFAKLALTALTAHCLALAASAGTAAPATLPGWLRILAPAVLFVALLAVALVQVDDYSPLVLLAFWAGCMALACALASNRMRLAAGIAALACMTVAAIAVLQQEAPGRVQAMQFYGDRFQVWLDPEAHPHTGQQVLRAAGAIAAGGTWGADRALGLATLGQGGAPAQRIPAVQDDFAPAFFLHRHGIAGGLALWLLQSLLLAGLARLAVRSWQASVAARDFRSAWFERLRCFTLAGGGAFLGGHLLLSWGTNLGMLPVMGQPMSFLSAGGSHLLFFICPLLVFAATSAESFEENESCRSTSNMKPLAR